jgi:hypothetical protein
MDTRSLKSTEVGESQDLKKEANKRGALTLCGMQREGRSGERRTRAGEGYSRTEERSGRNKSGQGKKASK